MKYEEQQQLVLFSSFRYALEVPARDSQAMLSQQELLPSRLGRAVLSRRPRDTRPFDIKPGVLSEIHRPR